jgi:lysophospholipase L1-like esterase
MAYTQTLTAGARSVPTWTGNKGSVVTVTPSGGTAYLEYTQGSPADSNNGSATWTQWPAGTVITTTSDVLTQTVGIRVTCVSGTATVTITDGNDQVLSNIQQPWFSQNPALLKTRSPTVVLLGDSLTANNYVTAGTPVNFWDYAAEGSWNWANALSGSRFNVVAAKGVAGNTLANMIARFGIDVAPYAPKYVRLVGGVNDIYNETASTATITARFETLIKMIQDMGAVPIISTVWARSYSSAALMRVHLAVNDFLRTRAYLDKNVKLWDGFAASTDPAVAPAAPQPTIRTGWTYDSAPNLHPNNLGAYWLGKKEAALLATLEPAFPYLAGAEDYTGVGGASGDTSNLLDNVTFQAGTGGTLGTGMTAGTGTIPQGWTVQRVAGTPTATVNVVDQTDPDTGLVLGKYIEVAATGAAANGEIQLISANLSARGAAGGVYEGEMSFQVPTIGTTLDSIRMRVKTDSGTGESAWWGSSAQTAAVYPEIIPACRIRTPRSTSVAAPTTLQLDARIRFSGIGSSTIRFWLPRLRRVS